VPTYRIVTLGCKLNQAETTAVEARLRRLGLRPVDEDGALRSGGADLVVLNTCTVTARADRDARRIARSLRRANPRALLIATGCYAERDAPSLRALAGIDQIVGLQDQADRIEAMAASLPALRDAPPPGTLGPHGATGACESTATSGERTRAYLKIQDGCNLRCSYCIIPAVRGSSRSIPVDTVLREVDRLAAAGYREIVFTGVNTGDYGTDLSPSLRLHDLVREALRRPGLGRLRLNSLEPKTVSGEIIALLAGSDGRLARHLQIPLQSGSDAVLRRMRRPYRVAEYARILERLRRASPDMALGADVIVGFPEETELEFEATLRFITSSPLNYLHVFSYSPRPSTPAAGLQEVAAGVIKDRSARLRGLGGELARRFRSGFVDRELPVLTLHDARPDGRLRALSDNYIDLDLDVGPGRSAALQNRLLRARVTGVAADRVLARLAGPATVTAYR
jgi:threonylcarbamoyladenosine tRNA methylthiotransferase MtaB